MTKARVVLEIDPNSRTIQCKRDSITSEVHALSHRWQEREGATEWTVSCDDDEYTCLLFDVEVTNLISYIESYGPLWLDYICIKQGDSADKIAQVSIMGSIYSNATSLVVGLDLAPCMPPRDYLRRAWCIQERMFGKVKFPWDLESEDPAYIIEFATDILVRLPGVQAIADKLWDDYDDTEDWRLRTLEDSKSRYPQAEDEIDQAIALMEQNEKLELAKLALKIRQMVSCDDVVDERAWNEKMFDCECSYELDRLFGVWGVPMHHVGVQLPYDNPKKAWQLIVQNYPGAEHAYHSKSGVGKHKSQLISLRAHHHEDKSSHVPVTDTIHSLLGLGVPSEEPASQTHTWEYEHYPEPCDEDEVLKVSIHLGDGYLSIVPDHPKAKLCGFVISYRALRAHHDKAEHAFLSMTNRCKSVGYTIYWRCPFELHNYVTEKVQQGEWA